VPICRELNTPAGPINNFLVTPSGLPVLVEPKFGSLGFGMGSRNVAFSRG
jgi:hypothetical protein